MNNHSINFRLLATCGCAMFLSACADPAYRYDVRGNGEGGVEMSTTPAPPRATAAPAQSAPSVDQQQRIDELEARVRALSAENEKLKQSATTRP